MGEHAIDLTSEELAFGKAMDKFKRDHRLIFLTHSEVLKVVKALGYRLVAEPTEV